MHTMNSSMGPGKYMVHYTDLISWFANGYCILNDLNWVSFASITISDKAMYIIFWNHVFHQKFLNMECGWAGHYHYPL